MQEKSLKNRKKSENPISVRLKQAIRLAGFSSNKEFFEKSGVRKSTYHSIVSEGRTPNSNTRALIENVGINTDWVLNGVGLPLLNTDDRTYPESERITGDIVRDDSQNDQHTVRGDSALDKLRMYRDGVSSLDSSEVKYLVLEVIEKIPKEEAKKLLKMAEILLEEKKDNGE
jgi:hypothetical protein